MGIGLLISVILARKLGPSALGQYALVVSVSAMVMGLSDMGIGQTAIRYATRALTTGGSSAHFAVLRWAFRLRMALVSLVVVAACYLAPTIATHAWHQPQLASLIQLSLLTCIFSAIAAIPAIYFQSLKRFGMTSFVRVVQAVLKMVGILLLAWWNDWSLVQIMTVTIVSTAIGAGIMLFLVPRAILIADSRDVRKRSFLERIKTFWQNPVQEEPETEAHSVEKPNTFAFYMFLSALMLMITQQMDIWLMGYYLETEMVGKFHVAMRIMLPLTFFLTALNTALWPRAASLKDPEAIVGLAKRTVRLTLLAMIPLVLYSVFVPMVAPYIFGDQYDDIVLLSQLLCLRFLFTLLINPIGLIGYSLGLVRLYCVMSVVNLAILTAVEIFFLSKIGIYAPVLAKMVITVTSIMFLLPPTIKYYKEHRGQ